MREIQFGITLIPSTKGPKMLASGLLEIVVILKSTYDRGGKFGIGR
jgi:hypothetical protein